MNVNKYIAGCESLLGRRGYQYTGFLGKGTYGVVLTVERVVPKPPPNAVSTAAYVAKVQDWFDCQDELRALQGLPEHENMLRPIAFISGVKEHLGVIIFPRRLFDLQRFCDHCRDLHGNYLGMPHSVVMSLTLQMFSCLAFLHSFSVLHLDIKPQNMLISLDSKSSVVQNAMNERNLDVRHLYPNIILQICDFGLAIKNERVFKDSCIVTPTYRSPELILKLHSATTMKTPAFPKAWKVAFIDGSHLERMKDDDRVKLEEAVRIQKGKDISAWIADIRDQIRVQKTTCAKSPSKERSKYALEGYDELISLNNLSLKYPHRVRVNDIILEPRYETPELCVQDITFGDEVDVWSAGVVFRILCTNKDFKGDRRCISITDYGSLIEIYRIFGKAKKPGVFCNDSDLEDLSPKQKEQYRGFQRNFEAFHRDFPDLKPLEDKLRYKELCAIPSVLRDGDKKSSSEKFERWCADLLSISKDLADHVRVCRDDFFEVESEHVKNMKLGVVKDALNVDPGGRKTAEECTLGILNSLSLNKPDEGEEAAPDEVRSKRIRMA